MAARIFCRGASRQRARRRVAFHGTLGLGYPAEQQVHQPFLSALEVEASAFAGAVLLVRGDDHESVVDHPLHDRRTGAVIQSVTRMMVPGSPDVGWVRAIVTPGTPPRFEFESRVVSWRKYW